MIGLFALTPHARAYMRNNGFTLSHPITPAKLVKKCEFLGEGSGLRADR